MLPVYIHFSNILANLNSCRLAGDQIGRDVQHNRSSSYYHIRGCIATSAELNAEIGQLTTRTNFPLESL